MAQVKSGHGDLNAAALGQLAALMNAGRFPEVESWTRDLLNRHSAFGPLWKLHGAALAMQSKDAVPAFDRARRLLPGDPDAHYGHAEALLDHGDHAAALESYRRALELKPGWPEALNNQGTALMALGRSEEALQCFDRALEVRPDFADALGSRGDALQALGRYAEAIDSYQRMLRLTPDVAAAYNNMGNALRNLGRPREAVACCQRALELAPQFADAHRFLGNAWFDLGRFDEAAACYDRALVIQPNLAEAHTARSVVLRQTGRSVEAEASCRRALELQPDSPDSIALLGEIFASQGRFAEAEREFQRALTIDPKLPEAWAGIVRNRKMAADDVTWRDAVLQLINQPMPLHHQVLLHFALGKYFDDVEDYAMAFTHYRTANELSKHYGMKHDSVQLTRRVDRIVSTYDAEWLRVARRANPSPRAVFVVGMPRAGTTLAEQILASHPQVCGAGELRFWHAAATEYDAVRDTPRSTEILRDLAARYSSQLDGHSPDALRVIDKMPANTMNLGLIHAALPHARIIHVRRNPIDTCLSIYFQIFSNTHAYANDLEHLAHFYRQYLRVMRHWHTTLPEGVILDVPYEGLIENTETWSRRMIEFLGLPWDPRCLNFQDTPRTITTASSWQVRQKISGSSVGRWHHYEEFVGPLRPLLDTESP